MRRLLLALVVVLVGCKEDHAHIREVERPRPKERPAPVRFELVETATVETGSKVELWFPLASSEAGVQDVERLDVTIKPDLPHEVAADSRGNRVLHVAGAAPLSIRVTYRVVRRPLHLDVEKDEKRALTDGEKKMFASELSPTTWHDLARWRDAGVPARRASGLEPYGLEPLPGEGVVFRSPERKWVEVYRPGLAWTPAGEDGASDGRGIPTLPDRLLIVAHGSDRPLPWALVDGSETASKLEVSASVLE